MELHRRYDFLVQQRDDFSIYKDIDWKTYQSDRRLRRELERWVEQTLNALLDVAKIIIAERKEPLPDTNREILKRAGAIFCPEILQPCSTGRSVADRWSELRNQMAHEYLDMRWDGIKNFMEFSIPVINRFLSVLKERINGRES